MKALDRAALEARIRDREDVEPDELTQLIEQGGADAVRARYALYATRFRQTVDALGALAASEDYGVQRTLDLLQQLAPAAENEIPLVEAFKHVGMQAARQGRFEDAARMLEGAAARAGTIGQRNDARSRSAMRYLLDREMDEAYGALGATLQAIDEAPPFEGTLHVAFVVSGIADDNSGTRVVAQMVRGLRDRGHRVTLVSTEYVASAGSAATALLASEGFELRRAAGSGYRNRVESVLDALRADPAHVALYLTFPMDAAAKLLASAGAARAQVFMNTSYEQYCGRFDAILETVSEAQIARSTDPAIARFVGTGIVEGTAIERAQPAERSVFGAGADAFVIGTFGRLQKCCEPGFLRAVGAVLSRLPRAIWCFAGPAYDREEEIMRQHFAAAGVLERVRFLGRRERDVPQLLKALDAYGDTFPFPGAQSILEAMAAGVPVVAMRTVSDPNLDPSGTGPTTATAEVFIGESAPLAPGGDVEAYVELAARYAADLAFRRGVGAALRTRARECFSFETMMDRIEDVLVDAVRRHQVHASAALTAVVPIEGGAGLQEMIASFVADDAAPHVDRLVLVANGADEETWRILAAFSGAVRVKRLRERAPEEAVWLFGARGERADHFAFFRRPRAVSRGWSVPLVARAADGPAEEADIRIVRGDAGVPLVSQGIP